MEVLVFDGLLYFTLAHFSTNRLVGGKKSRIRMLILKKQQLKHSLKRRRYDNGQDHFFTLVFHYDVDILSNRHGNI